MADSIHSGPAVPRATYRVQFNEQFRLNDALTLVPYLDELGISHLYASPLSRALPHSRHGYDVCDFSQLNPEIGTEEDLERLVSALHAHNMGLVLDIVPNHMGIGGPENRWWWDVLKNGPDSCYAGYFDINWQPLDPELRGKILVPILGDPYDEILAGHELQVHLEQNRFTLRYHEHRLPLAPASEERLPKRPEAIQKLNSSLPRLNALIQKQHYRLAFYQEGNEKLNYRRFFAISSLAALRVEDERVFDDVHALPRRWYEKGWIDGLRVDHPDGLRDPEQYLRRLRALAPKAWIVVEKILKPEESLPDAWPVAGTTGYDFLNQAGGILVDPAGEKALSALYHDFTGETGGYAALVQEKKRVVLETLLVSEIRRLAGLLDGIAAHHKDSEDFGRPQTMEALVEMIACFPVYRSYLAPDRGAITATDVASVEFAVHLACKKRSDLPPKLFAQIQDVLLKPQRSRAARDFVYRFQQLTSPAMAKGEEDTAFYCFNRFLPLNEVGGDPAHFGLRLENFQEFCNHLHQHWPDTMLASSTHDTKRSEDVRARLSAISEIPDEWAHIVRRWSAINVPRRHDDWPDRDAEYLFYQTLAGAWPLSLERIQAFMKKAVREAKRHTDWTKPNQPYEAALHHFIAESLGDPEFTADVERFISTLEDAGRINSLTQLLVKLTAPGVPDIYQGCELWNFALVDPDNRRPVDFQLRHRLLAEAKALSAEQAWRHRAEGLPKLWMLRRVLALRARQTRLFAGRLQILPAQGARAGHVLAFSRGDNLVAICPRFLLKLNNDWANTTLALPHGYWRSEFTNEVFSGTLRLETFFQAFPVVLLVRKENK